MALEPQAIFERLEDQNDAWATGVQVDVLDPWIDVAVEHLPAVARYLRETPELSFKMLHCITAVDYLETDPKKAAKVDWEPHLELVYHLSSLEHRHRIVLKLHLPRWKDDVPGQLPEVPSVADVWPTANWHEREVYDLSGVRFLGHPDFRRILCPEDWQGHPLRKDYEMPIDYHGIRVR
jgi:NADH-quinone oxidoreductase subunit C